MRKGGVAKCASRNGADGKVTITRGRSRIKRITAQRDFGVGSDTPINADIEGGRATAFDGTAIARRTHVDEGRKPYGNRIKKVATRRTRAIDGHKS